MTTEKYESLKIEWFSNRSKMAGGKAKEYASDDDRLINFKRIGNELGLDPLTVLSVYWKKHVDSIMTYFRQISEGKPIDEIHAGLTEPIEGRILDCQEYLDLMRALIAERIEE